jgi:hypothetical protein
MSKFFGFLFQFFSYLYSRNFDKENIFDSWYFSTLVILYLLLEENYWFFIYVMCYIIYNDEFIIFIAEKKKQNDLIFKVTGQPKCLLILKSSG